MSIAATAKVSAGKVADRRELLGCLIWKLGPAMCLANTVGAGVVFVYLGFLLPYPETVHDRHHAIAVNFVAWLIYTTAALAVGTVISLRIAAPIRCWIRGDEPATDDIRRYVVRHPLRQSALHLAIWMLSEAVFVPLNANEGPTAIAEVATAIALGGIATSGLSYLTAERAMRPITAEAMRSAAVPDPYVPGVRSRLLAAWALGTGVPLVGVILLVAVHGDRQLSASSVLFLAVIGMVSGAMATLVAAKSVADPVVSVTSAMAAVEAGRLDVTVPVYDASQVGRLQSGFNTMVEGLRERTRLRDLFGRQVGEDVARHALHRGVDFEGETLHVAVLFVDVIGSTRLAATRPAGEVVATLNSFFGVVVDVVNRSGGFVNKFEGDAALCLFGAPVPRDDAATCALVAARVLAERLTDVRGLSAAVGVATGSVVVGNVGTPERYEYTAVGDAVNEAARLTELAKAQPHRLLASAALLDEAGAEEVERWVVDGEVVLRGRDAPTRLAMPLTHRDSAGLPSQPYPAATERPARRPRQSRSAPGGEPSTRRRSTARAGRREE